MNFEIPEELKRLRESARRFVAEELLPLELPLVELGFEHGGRYTLK